MKDVNKFIKNNYDRFSLLLPAGSKEIIRERVKVLCDGGYITAESINRYIGCLIAADLKGGIVWQYENGVVSGKVDDAEKIKVIVDDI